MSSRSPIELISCWARARAMHGGVCQPSLSVCVEHHVTQLIHGGWRARTRNQYLISSSAPLRLCALCVDPVSSPGVRAAAPAHTKREGRISSVIQATSVLALRLRCERTLEGNARIRRIARALDLHPIVAPTARHRQVHCVGTSRGHHSWWGRRATSLDGFIVRSEARSVKFVNSRTNTT